MRMKSVTSLNLSLSSVKPDWRRARLKLSHRTVGVKRKWNYMPGAPRSGPSHRSSHRSRSITLRDLCELRWPGLATLQILVCRSYSSRVASNSVARRKFFVKLLKPCNRLMNREGRHAIPMFRDCDPHKISHKTREDFMKTS